MLSKCTIITTVILATVHCLSMVPERANVTSSNDKWVLNPRIWISRLSRRSPYFSNIEINIRHTFGNNVTIHVLFYEFLNNEYRRTFMEIHSPLCNLFKNFPLDIGTMFLQRGIKCPTPPGFYRAYNLTLPMPNFHYVIPFVKFKAEMELRSDTNQSIATGYIYGSFITERRKKKN